MSSCIARGRRKRPTRKKCFSCRMAAHRGPPPRAPANGWLGVCAILHLSSLAHPRSFFLVFGTWALGYNNDGGGELNFFWKSRSNRAIIWQAPSSTQQKTKRKTRPAIRRSARWRTGRHVGAGCRDGTFEGKAMGVRAAVLWRTETSVLVWKYGNRPKSRACIPFRGQCFFALFWCVFEFRSGGRGGGLVLGGVFALCG